MRPAGQIRTGALLLLSACFLTSGLLRAGDVVAALPGGQAGATPVAPNHGPAVTAPEPAPDLGALAVELKRRRAELDRREAALVEREQLLQAVEARIKLRLEEMAKAQEKLANTAAMVEDAAGRDVRHLVEMYQQMKPKQAGAIFDTMAPNFAAGFLGQMDASAAGLILANMQPEKAYAVSLLLAGRNVERK